jgi:mxaK protein
MQLSALSAIMPWRGPLLWLMATLAFIVSASTLVEFWKTKNANQTIRSLADYKDIPIDPNRAQSEVILARINELIARERLDDAQTLLSSAETHIEPGVRARALYNLANERTRQGAEFVRKGDLDHAAALINVAKSQYRLALKLKPEDWNTKYNLDVAMRIVRDLPQADNIPNQQQETPKKVWTDLPGVPKGLP